MSFSGPRPQTSEFRDLKIFHIKIHKILHQICTYFQILDPFWQSYQCLFPENCKNTLQESSFWCHFRYVRSLQVFPKNPIFWSTKTQISLQTLGQIWKMSPFWNPLIKGFQMLWKSNNFDKVSILADLPTFCILCVSVTVSAWFSSGSRLMGLSEYCEGL